jgi:hypothetical protein
MIVCWPKRLKIKTTNSTELTKTGYKYTNSAFFNKRDAAPSTSATKDNALPQYGFFFKNMSGTKNKPANQKGISRNLNIQMDSGSNAANITSIDAP